MRTVEKALRLGQAADELGTSRYVLQKLCELGMIEGERTPGGHWRIPWAEVERLKIEGLPKLPSLISADDEDPASSPGSRHGEEPQDESPEVIKAGDETKIMRSRLEKRRIEKELEETEDFFRERQREQAAEEATERNKAISLQAKQHRQEQIRRWEKFALGWQCLPLFHPEEAELVVHQSVHELLSSPNFDFYQPEEITRKLVIAAAKKAYAPWASNEHRKTAKQAAMASLPWNMQYDSAYAKLKQQAGDSVDNALRKLPAGADRDEVHKTAMEAVQPMLAEFNHFAECDRICASLSHYLDLSGATPAEFEEAKEAVRSAVIALPIGATQNQKDKAKQAALAPYQAKIAARKKAGEVKAQQEQQHSDVERRINGHLGHVWDYLVKLENEDEIEFEGHWDRVATSDKFKERIRPILVKRLLREPGLTDENLKNQVERLVDRYFYEFVDEIDDH